MDLLWLATVIPAAAAVINAGLAFRALRHLTLEQGPRVFYIGAKFAELSDPNGSLGGRFTVCRQDVELGFGSFRARLKLLARTGAALGGHRGGFPAQERNAKPTE
jgi:hypothetical protein